MANYYYWFGNRYPALPRDDDEQPAPRSTRPPVAGPPAPRGYATWWDTLREADREPEQGSGPGMPEVRPLAWPTQQSRPGTLRDIIQQQYATPSPAAQTYLPLITRDGTASVPPPALVARPAKETKAPGIAAAAAPPLAWQAKPFLDFGQDALGNLADDFRRTTVGDVAASLAPTVNNMVDTLAPIVSYPARRLGITADDVPTPPEIGAAIGGALGSAVDTINRVTDNPVVHAFIQGQAFAEALDPATLRPTTLGGELQTAKGLGLLGAPMYLAQRLFEETSEKPFVAFRAAAQAAEKDPRMARLQTEDARILARQQQVNSGQIKAPFAEVSRMIARRKEISREMSAIRTEYSLDRPSGGGLFTPTVAEQQEYRANEPLSHQLLTGLLFDPLNPVDVILGKGKQAISLARAAAKDAPAMAQVVEAGQKVSRPTTMAEELALLKRWNEPVTLADKIAKATRSINPRAWTPQYMGEELTRQAVNTLNRLNTDAPEIIRDPELLKLAVTDPNHEQIVKLTGGLSLSRPFKQTMLLIQRAIGATPLEAEAKYTAAMKKAEEGLTYWSTQLEQAQGRLDQMDAAREGKRLAKREDMTRKVEVIRAEDEAAKQAAANANERVEQARQAAQAATARLEELKKAGKPTDAAANSARAKAEAVTRAEIAAKKKANAAANKARQLANAEKDLERFEQAALDTNAPMRKQVATIRQRRDAVQQRITDLKRQGPQAGALDFETIQKIAEKGGDPRLEIVAELARQFTDAAESLFPTTASIPASKAFKIRNAVYNAMSIGYLGMNPGYAFRNLANNLITALADGVDPFQSYDHMMELWKRWGPPPVESKQGLGQASDIWRTRQTALAHIESLTTPESWRNVLDPHGEKWYRYSQAVAQNFERLISERIVAHTIERYYTEIWGGYVKALGKEMLKAGVLTPEQVRYWQHLAHGKMNRRELMQLAEQMARGSGNLAHTVPVDDAVRLVQEVGPGADRAAREIASLSPEGQQAAVGVENLRAEEAEAVADAGAQVDEVVEQHVTLPEPLPPTAQRDEVLEFLRQNRPNLQRYFDELRRIEREFIAGHQRRTRDVWQQTRNLEWQEADVLWQRYWATTQTELRQFYNRLNAAEESIGRNVGFTDEAIQRAQKYREFCIRHREDYIRRLQDTWARSRKAAGDKAARAAARDSIWDDYYAWSDAHFAKRYTREDVFFQQRIDDINEAIIRGGRGGGAAPMTPTGPAPAPSGAPTRKPWESPAIIREKQRRGKPLVEPEAAPAIQPPTPPAAPPQPEMPDEALLPELRKRKPKPFQPEHVQRAVSRAQTIRAYWGSKQGTYRPNDELLPPGGKSGKAKGGTKQEANERHATTMVERMETLLARADEQGLTEAEVKEIEKAWNNVPAAVRKPKGVEPPAAQPPMPPSAPEAPIAPIKKPWQSPAIIREKQRRGKPLVEPEPPTPPAAPASAPTAPDAAAERKAQARRLIFDRGAVLPERPKPAAEEPFNWNPEEVRGPVPRDRDYWVYRGQVESVLAEYNDLDGVKVGETSPAAYRKRALEQELEDLGYFTSKKWEDRYANYQFMQQHGGELPDHWPLSYFEQPRITAEWQGIAPNWREWTAEGQPVPPQPDAARQEQIRRLTSERGHVLPEQPKPVAERQEPPAPPAQAAPEPKPAPAPSPAPAPAQTAKTWETLDDGRMFLPLSKAEYNALPQASQDEIKRFFVMSPKRKGWVSKGKAADPKYRKMAQRAGFGEPGANVVTEGEARAAMDRLGKLAEVARKYVRTRPDADYDSFLAALRGGNVDHAGYWLEDGAALDSKRLVADLRAAGWVQGELANPRGWFDEATKYVQRPEAPLTGEPPVDPLVQLRNDLASRSDDAMVAAYKRANERIRSGKGPDGKPMTPDQIADDRKIRAEYARELERRGIDPADIDSRGKIKPEKPAAPEEQGYERPTTPEDIQQRTAAEAARPEPATPQPASSPAEAYPDAGAGARTRQPRDTDTAPVAGRAAADVQGDRGEAPAGNGVRSTGRGRKPAGDAAAGTGDAPRRGDGSGVAGSGVDERGGRGGGGAGTSGPRIRRLNKPRGPDFVFSPAFAETIDNGGYKTKIRQNLDAIELVKQLEAENRKATIAEQEVLAKFSGWGGAWQIFDDKYTGPVRYDYQSGEYIFTNGELSDEANRLLKLIGKQEYDSARASTKNAHYTDTQTISFGWSVLRKLGFTGGRTLEPAMGVGRFYGMMPTDLADASVRAGVELDIISGRIAQNLFQNVDVRVGGYETMGFRPGFFDVIVSNVPFGNYGVFDQAIKDKRLKASIHNYYFAKALEHVRPGGIIGFITSAFTMDATDDAVRRYIGQRAELVAMYRLPAGQFRKSAHTDVVTDFVFLRKLEPGETPPAHPSWLNVTEVPDPNTRKPIRVNAYYAEHPENVFGRLELETGGQYQGEHMTVKPDGRNIQTLYQQAVDALPSGVYKHPMDSAPTAADTVEATIAPTGILDGQHVIVDGQVMVNERGVMKPLGKGLVNDRVRGMSELTDIGRELVRRMVSADATDEEIQAGQRLLNARYDEYVRKYGPIHSTANTRAMRGDPMMPFLLGLEDYDPATKTASKAPLFSKRVISPTAAAAANTPHEALAASLLRRGRIDPAYIEKVTGKAADETLQVLEDDGLIFYTPSGNYVQRETYLSGNVREKFAEAEEAARTDPRFLANVKALEAVLPPDLPADEITLRMGLPLVPPRALEDFISSYNGLNLGRPTLAYQPHNGEWLTTWDFKGQHYLLQNTWGTERRPADKLIEDILNNKTTAVFDIHPDGSRSLNATETELARTKRKAIEERWEQWWRKSDWSKPLTKKYNESFNAYVRPEYNGAHLLQPGAIPGMADVVDGKALALRDYQANAIWRIVTSPNVLLAHTVGAGKTYTMIAAGMYMRRAGIIKRPVYVVPNHLLDQWAGDFGRLFPGAKILVEGNEYAGAAGRERFIARAAAGDWDAIIVPYSKFKLISIRPENEMRFIEEEMQLLREFLGEQQVGDISFSRRGRSAADRSRDATVKQAEAALEKLENRLKELQNPKSGKKTAALNFEDMGADYLFLDESHNYKNLQYQTNRGRDVKGLGPVAGSKRSFDLSQKIRLVQAANGGKGATLASGTPVSNSLVEMYTIMRYLLRDDLKRLGAERFDRWADAFGSVVGAMERTQIGDYKVVNRLREFNNYDELMALFYQVADIRNAKQINLPRPAMKGGKAHAIVLDMDEAQKAIMAGMPDRAEKIKTRAVSPSVDNYLKLGSDSRKASVDARFFDPDAPENPNGKLAAAAREVLRIYKETDLYKGAQVVFLDLGVPGGDTFNAYDVLIDKLKAGGIPENEIAYTQEKRFAKGKARQELYNDVRAGRVRVLLSSSEKLATGANIQNRLAALHHLDSPGRWSDIEQREGRILRPGNLHIGYEGNPLFGKDGRPVEIIRYLMRDSFDEWTWDKLERTARYQAAVMNGDVKGRKVIIDDDVSMDPAEMKAVMSGNPLVREKAGLDLKLTQLAVSKAAHEREQARFRSDLLFIPNKIANAQARIDALKDALASARPLVEKFEMTVGDETFRAAEDAPYKRAGIALAKIVHDEATPEMEVVGRVGNFMLRKIVQRRGDEVRVGVEIVHPGGWVDASNVYADMDTINAQGVMGKVKGIEAEYLRAQQKLEGLQGERQQLEEAIGKPWDRQAEYDQLRERSAAIEKELIGDKKPTDDDVIEDDASLAAGKRREKSDEDVDDELNDLDEAGGAGDDLDYTGEGSGVGITYNPRRQAEVMADATHAAARSFANYLRGLQPTPQEVPALTPEQAAWLRKFTAETAAPKMLRAKQTTSRLAVDARNFALGDYAARRNIHEWLTFLYPYAFWHSFTYPAWGVRLATHPSMLSNYARYRVALQRANDEYYQELTGDPNAKMPANWSGQLRVPFHGTTLHFNLERTLNPLYALIDNFSVSERERAPLPWTVNIPEDERQWWQSGELLARLGDYGPSPNPLMPLIYALWLQSQPGQQEAAMQWQSGYLTTPTRVLRGVTALAREKAPALRGIIPPGGWIPESYLFPWMAGGDYWQMRSAIPAALVGLYKNGAISATDMQDAAYSRDEWGSGWGDAAQQQALKSLGGTLASWMLGQGFKPTDITDIEIAQMWNDRDKLPKKSDPGVSNEEYGAAWTAFKQKYPWYEVFALAREQDPIERLDTFAGLVLNRLPPGGAERARLLDEAGISDEQLDSYYSNKWSTQQMTEADRKVFELGILKLAGQVVVPPPEQQAEYDQYRTETKTIDQAAAAAAGVTVEEYKRVNRLYNDAPEGSAERIALLRQYPWLKKAWDAARAAKEQAPVHLQYGTAPTKAQAGGSTASDGTVERPVTVTEADRKIAEAQALYESEAARRFGADILDQNSQYGALETQAAKGAFKREYPQIYDNLIAFWKWRDQFKAQHPEWAAYKWPNDSQSTASGSTRTNSAGGSTAHSAGRSAGRSTTYQEYVPRSYGGGGGRSYGGGGYYAPSTPVARGPVYERWTPQDYQAALTEERNDDPSFDVLVTVMFGADMLTMTSQYYAMTPEQRAAWIAANPQLWARLMRFLVWLAAQRGVKTDYAKLLQQQQASTPTPPAPPGSLPPNAPFVPSAMPPTPHS